ncbi:response regulator [candidate division KSB1 bacterium]|nr:response regulator [candidate division KSB1 bacterium]
MRVLIVEDDLNTLDGLWELLSDEGYSVIGVSDATQALDVIKRERIDVVLCDYSLPDMKGDQLCEILKKQQPELILFMITAYYDDKLERLLKEGTVKKIFKKPLILEDLFQALALSTQKRQSTNENDS